MDSWHLYIAWCFNVHIFRIYLSRISDSDKKLSAEDCYGLSDSSGDNEHHQKYTNEMIHSTSSDIVTDSEGLILPRKLANPYLESRDRRDLHRELLFNQKIGRSVIGQKSELECALQKQKERQFILEQQQQQDNSRNDLEDEFSKVMMERAQKLEKSNLQQEEEHVDPQLNLEYLNARAKLRDVRSPFIALLENTLSPRQLSYINDGTKLMSRFAMLPHNVGNIFMSMITSPHSAYLVQQHAYILIPRYIRLCIFSLLFILCTQ
ncbi:uncharacterized protein LOC119660467 isoform X2 [Hermetia illucens]|uniref:uncharacterized protein LOC119660467 isoform X2 n=1 Tax=Hermetia illucens TaxID=343691 RepID=UPI0018CC5918|nr:uncharacterized protein LOC119660467 isoform X2 [Hermetia illucens]